MAEMSSKPVLVAVAAGASVAVAKFVAAGVTGSASMFAEGIHSLVDATNDSLLLFGRHQSQRPADASHPFGYGKELYFWSSVVALVILGAGGGVTIFEGVRRLLDPEPIGKPGWNYAILGFAAALEGYSCVVAFRQFRDERGDRGFWEAIRASKDPTTATVLLEDFAALAGLGVALIGVALGQVTGSPYPDAIASLVIGLILATIAVLLVRESKDLLVGERAEPKLIERIRKLVEADEAVEKAADPLTMHMGPSDVLLNLDIQFREGLSAADLETSVDRIESEIRAKHPEIKRIFLEIESLTQERRETARRRVEGHHRPEKGKGPIKRPKVTQP